MLTGETHWRAAAAGDADRAATTAEMFVDQTRRAGSRECIAVLRGVHSGAGRHRGCPCGCGMSPGAHVGVGRILAASVEKQARVSGLGRVTIPVGAAS